MTRRHKNGSAGADPATEARRRVLAGLAERSPEELFEVAVRAGIYDDNGQLTEPYRDEAGSSDCRPTD